ncbi:MAG TPA: hypothetical protein VFA86_02800 [Gammaproteobacteria bacterium]|nr:hypothetical protein [Gammaproteobacteria bacterium]
MVQSLIIEPRYCGPPSSGNGGYTAGLLARALGEPAEVTLRRPAPLGRPLGLVREGDTLRLLDGADTVAEAVPTAVETECPDPPTADQARAAAARSFSLAPDNPFPTCFVCGPDRRHGEGLEIFAGPVPGTGLFAAPWTPAPTLADARGEVRPEYVWAALDCPGAYTLRPVTTATVLLGRYAVRRLARVEAGREYVVIAWPLSHHRRKHLAGSALFDDRGACVAIARAAWIELRDPSREAVRT